MIFVAFPIAIAPPFDNVVGPEVGELPGQGDSTEENDVKRLALFWRVIIEMGFIIFLYYSNLLMGEFTRSNSAHGKNLAFALADIFTLTNFVIAIISAFIGFVVVEFLRRKI